MKKKLIIAGIAGLLILTTVLVVPVMGASNTDIATEITRKSTTDAPVGLDNLYKEMMCMLRYNTVPFNQIEALSDATRDILRGFDATLAGKIGIIFGSNSGQDVKQASKDIDKMLNNQVNLINTEKIEEALDNKVLSISDFDDDDQDEASKLYNDAKIYLNNYKHSGLRSLLVKAVSNIDGISWQTLLLIVIWMFFYGFCSTAVSGFDFIVGAVVGVAIGLGVSLLLGSAINALGALIDLNLPQWVKNMGITEIAPAIGAAVFGVAFAGFFLAYQLSWIVKGITGGLVLIGACYLIYSQLEESQGDSTSSSTAIYALGLK